jgi:WD repeat-containing protein 61
MATPLKLGNITKLEGHKNAVYSMSLDAPKLLLYTCGADGFVAKWDLAKNDFVQEPNATLFIKWPHAIWASSFIPFNNFLTIGDMHGNLSLFDTINNTQVASVNTLHKGIFAISFVEERYFIASQDGYVSSWNTELQCVNKAKISKGSVRSLKYLDSISCFIATTSDGTMVLLDKDLKILQTVQAHSQTVFGVDFNPLTNQFITGGKDAQIKVWSMLDFQINPEKNIPAHLLHVHAVAFSPCFEFFASASMDKSVKIWNAQTHELLKVIESPKFNAHTNCVNSILWLQSNQLLSCSDDRTIVLSEVINN